jgi:hypothetical protein
MRRLSAALVAITAAIALSALSAPAWAAKPTSKTLVVSPTKVKAGQMVKVSGGGCKGITVLIFIIDGKEFHRGNTKSGDFTYQLKLPRDLKSGDHDMWAECKGSKHKPARFHVDKGKKDKDDDDKGKDKNKDRDDDYGDKDKGKKDKKSKRSFNAYPDTVTRGDKVWVEGTGCKKYASVSIKLNGKTVKRTHADKWGTFDKLILPLPSHPQPDPLLRPGPLPMPRTKGDGFDTQAKLSCRLRPGCSLLSRARTLCQQQQRVSSGASSSQWPSVRSWPVRKVGSITSRSR